MKKLSAILQKKTGKSLQKPERNVYYQYLD